MTHRSGFVNIIGLPNTGKSTLLNALLGTRLSITTPKAQTTRHRILGILSGDDHQIVFSDTPGWVERTAYGLHERMNAFIETAFDDADAFILLVEAGMSPARVEHFIEKLKTATVPVYIAINKIDLIQKDGVLDQAFETWSSALPGARIIPISALEGFGVDTLTEALVDGLPEGPPYFDKEQLSDRHERFFVSEIIREKIFLQYKKEIPYSSEVVIEDYQTGTDQDHIRATILVERPTQKSIVIGKGGSAIKRLGIEARKDIEAFVGKHVFLELYVKVKEKWRSSDHILRQLGYTTD